MPKITNCLWFDKEAEEAANYYVSVFPNSKIKEISHHDESSSKASGMPEGTVLVVSFELDGYDFMGLNGGPIFKFNEAVSFVVDCKDQEEIDYYWEKLSAVKESEQCGWCKDKFGVSWQIVPTVLNEMLQDPDKEKAGRAMACMMDQHKLVISELQEAFDGKN